MCDVIAGDSPLISFSLSMLHSAADFAISAIIEKIAFPYSYVLLLLVLIRSSLCVYREAAIVSFFPTKTVVTCKIKLMQKCRKNVCKTVVKHLQKCCKMF